jgi:hypothetical protein
MEDAYCLHCRALTEAIDELSDLLAREQRKRLNISRENLKLRRLLVMDMEEIHDEEIESSTGI